METLDSGRPTAVDGRCDEYIDWDKDMLAYLEDHISRTKVLQGA
jgi:hypothetical protein